MTPWFPLLAACGPDATDPPGAAGACGGPCGAVAFDPPEVRGDGEFDVAWSDAGGVLRATVTATSPGAVFRGLHARGTWTAAGEADAVLWRQGYQSWSASGVFALGAVARDPDGWPVVGGDAGGFDVLLETPGTSWWAGLVGRPGGGAVLIGAADATRTKITTAFDADGTLDVVWGDRGEAVQLSPGEALALDAVEVRIGDDPNALWRDWADALASRRGVTLREPPPVGWSTWYQYYDGISEAAVHENLAAALALDPSLAPVGLFQIDDGWEVAWGEWTANDRFPSGTAGVAADLRAAGMIPGLWLAPFYVDRSTSTYARHPDWFVRDALGVELEYQGKVVLDVTHPAASAWLHDVIADRVAEGWTYLKLDFLYASAQEGQRHEPITGTEAYRLGLDLLRDAAGPDTWILACGAPLLPTVGWADSMRTGPDIAFTLAPDPERAFLRNQVRSTAARGFTNGRWWWIDADAVMVRAPYGPDEARGSVVSLAASGGAWLLGDAFSEMSGERLAWALDPDAVSTVGADVWPEDPLAWPSGFDTTPIVEASQGDDRVPERWTIVPRIGEATLTALLNLSDGPVTVEGPGGTELLTDGTAEAGPRTLPPGVGELWR